MALRVLVASRRSATRERLRVALESRGYDVPASCADAAETIPAARRRVDVCVIHLDLPGGGITACRAVAAKKGRPPRILVVAPSTREKDVTAAVRAGADGFIVDDLDPEQIPDAVAELAAGRPVLASGAAAQLITELRAANHREKR